MILCRKCHIDKDRCDRPQKAGTVVTYIMIAIAAIGCVFGAVSCNPAKKATKLFYRGMRVDAPTIYNECGKVAPPLDSQWDSTGFKIGEPYLLEPEYVYVNCDTVIIDSTKPNRIVKIPCPPCETRVDTFYKYNTKQVVNRAKEYALQAQVENQAKEIATMKERRNMWRIAAIVLACYTLLRWLLRYFTKGKINIP